MALKGAREEKHSGIATDECEKAVHGIFIFLLAVENAKK
jgi:hypothetical protein